MGKLADTIYGVPPDEVAAGGRCKVGSYLESLPPEDADDLKQALITKLGDKYVASGARISLAMSRLGHDLGATTIGEHRARLCRCYRKAAASG